MPGRMRRFTSTSSGSVESIPMPEAMKAKMNTPASATAA